MNGSSIDAYQIGTIALKVIVRPSVFGRKPSLCETRKEDHMLEYLQRYESVSESRTKTFMFYLRLNLVLLKILLVVVQLAAYRA